MTDNVCGECKFHLKRGVCPKAEYKKHEDNLTACLSSDPACPLFQSKRKRNNHEDKEKIKHSPGFFRDGTIFEQITDMKYLHGKDFEESSVFRLDDLVYQPLLRCPWTLASKAIKYSSSHELWNEVRQYIYEHLFLPNKELYDVLTGWILATWIQELWTVVPYLFFYGPVASGKTRGLEVLQRLCYRGILASNISTAALFRASEEWHPTLLLDETEIYNKDTKREIIGLLNSGYRRGQYAIRVKQTQQGSELEAFDVFGFKALAGTKGLAQALESRSIMIRMIKSRRRVNRIIDEKSGLDLRSKLLGWRLYTLTSGEPSELFELFSEGIPSLDFANGRLSELFTCLLAVSNEGHENIMKYAHKLYEMRSFEEKASEEAEIVEILIKKSLIDEKSFVLTKDLTEEFNSSRSEREKWKTSSVGWLIRRLGFNKIHTKRGNGWHIDEDRLKYLGEIYGIEPPSPEKVQKVQNIHQTVESAFSNTCFLCHESIPLLANLSNIDGRPAHKQCIKDLESERKKTKSCKISQLNSKQLNKHTKRKVT